MGTQKIRGGKIIRIWLIAFIFLALVLPVRPAAATALTSQFLSADANAAQVMSGTPYDMSVVPAALQMSNYEAVQCIAGQCVGWIKDAGGINDAPFRIGKCD